MKTTVKLFLLIICYLFLVYLIFLEATWFFNYDWFFSNKIYIKAFQYLAFTVTGLLAAISPVTIILLTSVTGKIYYYLKN